MAVEDKGNLKWRPPRSESGVYQPHTCTAQKTSDVMPLTLGPEQLNDQFLARELLQGAETDMVVVPLCATGYAGPVVVGVMACKRTPQGRVDKLIVSGGNKYSMRKFLHAGGTRSNCWETDLRVVQVSAVEGVVCAAVAVAAKRSPDTLSCRCCLCQAGMRFRPGQGPLMCCARGWGWILSTGSPELHHRLCQHRHLRQRQHLQQGWL